MSFWRKETEMIRQIIFMIVFDFALGCGSQQLVQLSALLSRYHDGTINLTEGSNTMQQLNPFLLILYSINAIVMKK